MATTKEIKRRIKSVKNTKKITKAMELVAASKMRRAVAKTLSSRTYAQFAWAVLQSLSEKSEHIDHPLLKVRSVKKVLLVLISSNRGLCGAYNSQIFKKMLEHIKNPKSLMINRVLDERIDSTIDVKDLEIDFIAVGKKAEHALVRSGQNVIASFNDLPDNVEFKDSIPISQLLLDKYKDEEYDKVAILYTDYESAISQIPKIRQVMPVSKIDLEKIIHGLDLMDHDKKVEEEEDIVDDTEYIFEPQASELIGVMTEKLSRMQIYQLILESKASEESSRMLAMKNASDAAGDMIDELTLVFNKARQASITQEISEISAGMASVE